MKVELEKSGVHAEFAGFGSGETPWSVPCFLDLISGKAFVPPTNRLDRTGRPPYVIEAFYPESNNAPWGVPLERFLDFKEPDLVRALEAYDEFRRVQSTSTSLAATVIPPEILPTLSEVRTVRLFFSVHRDADDVFSLTGSENRDAQLTYLAEGVQTAIVERILNLDTPLRKVFLAEIPTTDERKVMNDRTAAGQIQRTIEQFGLVETAKPEHTADAFRTAQTLARRSLELVHDRIWSAAARQVRVQFFGRREDAENSARRLLERFTDQAIIVSPRATANNVMRFVDHAEEHGDPQLKRLLLIQPGAEAQRA